MRQHAYYPTTMTTVTPLRVKARNAFGWLMLAIFLVSLCAATSLVIVKLVSVDAQLDSAFLQGMAAGGQLCTARN